MGKDNKFHVIYVKDLINAIIKAAEKKLTGINIFNIGNIEAPNIREYFNLFCKHLGVRRPFYIPFGVAYPLGVILEAAAKLMNACGPFILTRARVKMFYCNNIYDVSKSRKILDFTSETSLDEGVRETVGWWKQNGYLKNIK
jgi:nucleoside-diphosphate-sugar epimerase